ncbi:cupin domain-containing protein [Paludisphaera mucosa]|uniref:Cupin domain-containing protein n=1 Tax=Paludisphaera mucosa TaxID=3030827 RepID=A0ABT6FAL9_9BACT|nr:cupin domain-containing protein [Paludisphaera mucosa]MDG3004474.1 cupin domain-containing protein [Paludisphaera mucosa]
MAARDDLAARAVYSIVGDRYVFLATGAETAGACFIFEAYVPSGNGSPPHVHHREDELFYVVEGEFEFTVAGATMRLTAGGSLLGRRDVPHRFRNVGPDAGKLIIAVTPAGLDDYFMEVGAKLEGPDSPPIPPTPEDVARLREAAPRYGLEILDHA